MQFSVLFVFLTLMGVFCIPSAAYQCPEYTTIRDPSVLNFQPHRYQGLWYQVATNEPTMPSFCTCGTLNWTITSNTTFQDVFSAKCGFPFRLPLVGQLSTNASEPGYLHEGPALSLTVPNMVFNISSDYQFATVYSCLGLGLFSLQILSRTPNVSMSYVRNVVDEITRRGIMNTQGVRYDNFTECG
eukprot:PhF_6_TR4351/c0_g1_i1/m.5863/K03098/APOD; apolipoprotein D and lipocalin family protein